MQGRGATYTLQDRDCPTLEDVIQDISRMRLKKARRKRSGALLATFGRAWDRLYSEFSEVESARENYGWQDRGRMPAYWLLVASDVEWLDDESGTPKRPRELRVRTPGNVAIYGQTLQTTSTRVSTTRTGALSWRHSASPAIPAAPNWSLGSRVCETLRTKASGLSRKSSERLPSCTKLLPNHSCQLEGVPALVWSNFAVIFSMAMASYSPTWAGCLPKAFSPGLRSSADTRLSRQRSPIQAHSGGRSGYGSRPWKTAWTLYEQSLENVAHPDSMMRPSCSKLCGHSRSTQKPVSPRGSAQSCGNFRCGRAGAGCATVPCTQLEIQF